MTVDAVPIFYLSDSTIRVSVDALCVLLDCALGFFPCYFLFGCNSIYLSDYNSVPRIEQCFLGMQM